jgi:hypothetical protein
MHLTENQINHRAYLQSPLWKQIRQKAIDAYGTICGKCGNHGTDVHHLTYDRVGGNELLEDLQVLCRECHEAIHAIERSTKKDKKGKRSCSVKNLYHLLSEKQKKQLEEKYGGNAYALLFSPEQFGKLARRDACRMLGINKIEDDYRLECKVHIMNDVTKKFLIHYKEARRQGLDLKKFRKEYFSS